MKCIIPCAGYATRLYPLTNNFPKALLEVQGKPIVEHIIHKLKELEVVDGIFIVTNNKYHHHFQQWLATFHSSVPLTLLNDGTSSNEDRLGQIGDIHYVLQKHLIDDDVIIIAGDNLFNFSLREIMSFFRNKNAVVNGLYDARSLIIAQQQGNANIDIENKIVHFEEKPSHPQSTYVSLGIYFFPKEKVYLLNRYLIEGHNPDKMGYFMIWLVQQHSVYGYVYKDKWFDIGWHESLEQARREFCA